MGIKLFQSRDLRAVLFVTAYLFAYCMLLQIDKALFYANIMLAFAPFLLVWMVYTVLKHGKYTGPELGEDEFGYQDKNKDDLGLF